MSNMHMNERTDTVLVEKATEKSTKSTIDALIAEGLKICEDLEIP